MELTIGTACHNDFQGVYFTLQSLRMHCAQDVPRCELIVVDNDPDGQQGRWTRDLVENWIAPHAGRGPGNFAAARYVKAPEVEGTSAPRDRVFREAQGRAALCIDCHVLLWDGALRSLLDYHAEHPESRDLLSGPIVMDDLCTYGTHFDDVWRDDMWGVWATAWACPCGYMFCPREGPPLISGAPSATFHPLMGGDPLWGCPRCGKLIAVTNAWHGHEVPLASAGLQSVGWSSTDSEFEIPAMGLGLFSCRTDAWPGFNRAFRGFGGEEWYIHEKFRRAGGRCICLPRLKWVHRFTREGQRVPYPLNRWNKARNHAIGHMELDLPLDRLRDHFLSTGFPEDQWQEILDGSTWPSSEPGQEKFQHARSTVESLVFMQEARAR
jgi:rubredoxin